MRRSLLLVVLALAASSCSAQAGPIVVGAVYPTEGGQGVEGESEYRGVLLAAELVNARGGVNGRPVEVRFASASTPDQAAPAVARLHAQGVPVVLGSHGSTIARPAAEAATAHGLVYWETGAVGTLGMGRGGAARGGFAFRVSPTGAHLGRTGVAFARDVLLPKMRRDPDALRYAVAYVDDEYGRAVGLGAVEAIRAAGLDPVVIPYTLDAFDADAIASRLAGAGTQVLYVASYLDDAVQMREALLRHRVPLVASVGTSSSYCMHEFGVRLGDRALGLFASDKPDGDVLNADALAPDAAEALRWARAEYEERYEHAMTSHALTGFAAAWGLFTKVLPGAGGDAPVDVARAAMRVEVPEGGLPNGSGLEFRPVQGGASDNVRAASVIWEWVKPQTRAIVWPEAFATSPVIPMEVS